MMGALRRVCMELFESIDFQMNVKFSLPQLHLLDLGGDNIFQHI